MAAVPLDQPTLEALTQALSDTANAVDINDALEILAGLNGCPQQGGAADPDIWPRMFAAEPTPALRDALAHARAAMSAFNQEEPALGQRLALVREEMKRQGLDGFLVPHGDEHQSEFIPAASARLAWVTGFTGSAGAAVILAGKAAVFVDGRYTLQVVNQVDTDAYETLHLIETPPHEWIAENLSPGGVLGFDPWLHSADEVKRLEGAAKRAGGSAQAVECNPVDAVWKSRPARPLAPVLPHPDEFAGETANAKRQKLASALGDDDVDAVVLAQPDSMAWLLNIRGGDVAHTPLPLSFGILHADGRVGLFCDPRKVMAETRAHLGNGVTVEPLAALADGLEALGKRGASVGADMSSTPAWIVDRLTTSGASLCPMQDPCVAPRAAKNAVELQGARDAHQRDAVAVCRFLAWVDANGPSGEVGEVQAAEQLLAFRREVPRFMDQSFPTIAGYGSNGAIVHYRAMPGADRKLEPGSLFLVDSGGQYLDGTTDITRTVVIGQPNDWMRRTFTRVLQGNIRLSMACFPAGTNGAQLDAFARSALWEERLDFDHGTGHGVGSYLGVHEGPQRVAKSGTVVMEPGMIVSNEPGYYETGQFGIRTENLLAVQEADAPGQGGRRFLGFEVLTFAPIDRRLIEVDLLTDAERQWLNSYHADVRRIVADQLDEQTKAWLVAATEPV